MNGDQGRGNGAGSGEERRQEEGLRTGRAGPRLPQTGTGRTNNTGRTDPGQAPASSSQPGYRVDS